MGENGRRANFPQIDFTLRDADESDLNHITDIHIDGFTEEPQVHYCYPLRNKYPDDYWEWTKREYQSYLDQPEKFKVHVLELLVQSNGNVINKSIGFAVWNVAVMKAMNPGPGFDERKDANRKHCEAFSEMAGKRFKTYFAEWAEKQVNLSTLVVHPAFRRRGGGTKLVNWGIDAAKEKFWPVTLCASPMGQLLYEHLKFEKIDTEVVRVEGEKEILRSAVMIRSS